MTKPLFLIFKVMRNSHVNVLYCESETKKFVLKTITTNEVSTTEKKQLPAGVFVRQLERHFFRHLLANISTYRKQQ